VADEIYRGAELAGGAVSPTFWGRYDKIVITSGLSKAFGMPGLRVGWVVGPETFVRAFWERHDYTTLTPGMLSDILCGAVMEPTTRARILERTRGIIRSQLPRLEGWIHTHDDILRYVPPVAGAIAYVKYDLPVKSTRLAERIRREQSVLVVPGDVFGLGKGLRFGFGYDIEDTLKALARIDETLADAAAR
jgi:aspartate/methionine/tyrosine aminotransferase